jgi:hypothetical protein
MMYRIRIALLLTAVTMSLSMASSAQEAPTTAPTDTLAADSSDVQSVDAIIAALYDVISGPVGQERDWNRFRSLFLPSANLVPVFQDPQGTVQTIEMTPDDYIQRSGVQLVKMGFFESEIARVEERFGNMVHVFSTYEGFRGDDLETPFVRGINSIQVLFKDGRWWVASIAWQPEQVPAGIVLPDRYLPAAAAGNE